MGYLMSCYGAAPTAVKSAKNGSIPIKKGSTSNCDKKNDTSNYKTRKPVSNEKPAENSNFNEWLKWGFVEVIDNPITNNIFKNQLPSMLNSIQAFPKDVWDSINSLSRFRKALKFTLGIEGGYVNDPDDKGGATNYGITWSTYQRWLSRNGNKWRQEHGLSYTNPMDAQNSIKHITLREATEIYRTEYWIASGADKIPDLETAQAVFDTAVLQGVGTSINLYKESDGDKEKMLELRRKAFREIAANDPTQKKFLKGWLGRVDKLEREIGIA